MTDADAPCAEATSTEQGVDDLEDLFENAPCGYLSTDIGVILLDRYQPKAKNPQAGPVAACDRPA